VLSWNLGFTLVVGWQQMPHESSMAEQEDITFKEDEERLVQSRTRSRTVPYTAADHPSTGVAPPPPPLPGRRTRALSLVAETPAKITHHHDEDDDDDDDVSRTGRPAV